MTLEELAKNYKPGELAHTAVSASNTVLLVGISGAGKDTIQTKLLDSPDYHRIVTHTTRKPRRNNGVLEQDGREYHFVSRDEMRALLIDQRMIEINQYGDNFYGASVDELEYANSTRKISLTNIDVNGIASFRRLGEDAVRALFILPPSYEEWIDRISKRYSTDEEFTREFPARQTTAIDELEYALSVPYYHFIINDDLERAVRVVDEIAHREDSFNRHDDEARLAARDLLEAIRASSF